MEEFELQCGLWVVGCGYVYHSAFIVILTSHRAGRESRSYRIYFYVNCGSFQRAMDPGMAVDVQLPSILVGDCILLPIKIDITISGEISPSCSCILPSIVLMKFVLIIYATRCSLCCRCALRGYFLLEAVQLDIDT